MRRKTSSPFLMSDTSTTCNLLKMRLIELKRSMDIPLGVETCRHLRKANAVTWVYLHKKWSAYCQRSCIGAAMMTMIPNC